MALNFSGPDPVLEFPDPVARGPEATSLDQEFVAMMWDALAQLPEDWRRAVVLRDIDGLSTEEAAALVGVRAAAFKSRLHRGRMHLRALLEPYLNLESVSGSAALHAEPLSRPPGSKCETATIGAA